MVVQTIGSNDDSWADRTDVPPHLFNRRALIGQVAAAFALTAAVLIVPLAIIRVLL